MFVYITTQPILEWREDQKRHVFTGQYAKVNPSAQVLYSPGGVKYYEPMTPEELRRRHKSGETRKARRGKTPRL